MDLEAKRAVIRSLVTVTIARQGRGHRPRGWKRGESYSWFNPARVTIGWRGEDNSEDPITPGGPRSGGDRPGLVDHDDQLTGGRPQSATGCARYPGLPWDHGSGTGTQFWQSAMNASSTWRMLVLVMAAARVASVAGASPGRNYDHAGRHPARP